MAIFCDNTHFQVFNCPSCGVQYALTVEFEKRRRDDLKTFYCPNGHTIWFGGGESQADKLRREVAQKQAELDAEVAARRKAQEERDCIATAHRKMRDRVVNGVCPCCNRQFQNLLSHMRTQHPDFSNDASMKLLRTTFGMTQASVAKECGVNAMDVSLFEHGKRVSPWKQKRLQSWIDRHAVAA